MHRSRAASVLVALTAAAVLASCAREISSVVVARALHQEYPKSRIDVALSSASRTLALTVDDSLSHVLADSGLAARGRAMARFALQHYPAADGLDSITIMFVRERERGVLGESYSGELKRFATRDLR
jgi:hypothetical protein